MHSPNPFFVLQKKLPSHEKNNTLTLAFCKLTFLFGCTNNRTRLFYATTSPCTCVPSPLGIDNVDQDKYAIQFFPNPTSGNITVLWESRTQNPKMDIYDMTGKIVVSEKISRTSTEVNMEKFSPGIYLIRITDGKYSGTAKVIKE